MQCQREEMIASNEKIQVSEESGLGNWAGANWPTGAYGLG